MEKSPLVWEHNHPQRALDVRNKNKPRCPWQTKKYKEIIVSNETVPTKYQLLFITVIWVMS